MGVMGEWVFFSSLLFLFWFNFSLIGANDKNKVFYWSVTKTKTIKIPTHPTHPVKLTATEESFPKTSTPLRPLITSQTHLNVSRTSSSQHTSFFHLCFFPSVKKTNGSLYRCKVRRVWVITWSLTQFIQSVYVPLMVTVEMDVFIQAPIPNSQFDLSLFLQIYMIKVLSSLDRINVSLYCVRACVRACVRTCVRVCNNCVCFSGRCVINTWIFPNQMSLSSQRGSWWL